MRFTLKDVIGTFLAAAALAVTLAVTNGWGWPLLGDYRTGTIALAVIGFAMCGAASDYTATRWSHPLVALSAILGVIALGLLIAGLIWATATLFVWFAVVIVALWFVATVRHVTTPTEYRRAKPVLP